MLQAIKNKLSDIRTINALSLEAERQARLVALEHPGAEHYLLAALALQEGSAWRAFERIGADPAGVRPAIAAHHYQALAKAGMVADSEEDAEEALRGPPPRLFDASASGKALVQSLPKLRRAHHHGVLQGAHVLLAVAGIPNSTAARSLVHMGVDLDALARAAEQELQTAA